MSTPTRCPEEDQLACYLRLPFTGPRRVSTPLRRGGNGEEVQTRGVCMMDQILLRRSDEHTPRLKRNVSRPTSSMPVLKPATLCLLPPSPACAGQQRDQVQQQVGSAPGNCLPSPSSNPEVMRGGLVPGPARLSSDLSHASEPF
jgi:hypothetical protein